MLAAVFTVSLIHCQLVASPVMDHGDLLRECRHLLHAISSQISILLAGIQRIEGHQRHPQPPLPPAVPAVPVAPVPPQATSEPSNSTLPPLPPPRTPAPAFPKAPPTRTSFTSMPITLVATSANLAEGDPIEPISDSASRERNRRRRSRRRDTRRHFVLGAEVATGDRLTVVCLLNPQKTEVLLRKLLLQ